MLFQAVVGNRELILRSSASLINERLPSLWVPSESCGGRDLESNCRSWLVNVTCFSDDSKNIEWFIKWKRIFISPNGIIDWLVYFMNQKLHCVEMGDQSVNLEIGLVDWMTSIQVKWISSVCEKKRKAIEMWIRQPWDSNSASPNVWWIVGYFRSLRAVTAPSWIFNAVL